METEDGIALWRRVADALREMIATGDIEDRLPVESALAGRFGVNRHTVRRALAALAADGMVRAERGRGTFVTRLPRVAYPIGSRTRFSENVRKAAREPAGRLVAAERVAADLDLSRRLELPVGAPLHRLETLHVADGTPLSVATSWFSAQRLPTLVAAYAECGSITAALAAGGVADYRRRTTEVTAETVRPQDVEPLACAPDAPVLVAEALNVDTEGRPVQFSRSRFAADRIILVFES